jgi:transposase InsO family protein
MIASSSQGGLSIEEMCRLGRVSRAGYYRAWQAAAPRQEEVALRDAIQRLALANRRPGYRVITALLHREGWDANHKRVLRLMNEDNLLALRKRPFVPATTDSDHPWPIVPNLTRRLVPTGCDQIWVADITYIHLRDDFVYLAVVLDAFSRRVIGWALADHLQAILAIEALDMAIALRRPPRGSLIHHSDRGIQYACRDYTKRLDDHAIKPSMSRVGNPYDNAKAERFMRTLKEDEVDGTAYRDIDHAREQIGQFIETVYNRQRLHSALDYLTPEEYETEANRSAPGVPPAPIAPTNTCP